jgi:hypothetical protein
MVGRNQQVGWMVLIRGLKDAEVLNRSGFLSNVSSGHSMASAIAYQMPGIKRKLTLVVYSG